MAAQSQLQEAWLVGGGWKMSLRKLSRLGAVAVLAGCDIALVGAEVTAVSWRAHAALVATTAREQIKKIFAKVALLINVSIAGLNVHDSPACQGEYYRFKSF